MGFFDEVYWGNELGRGGQQVKKPTARSIEEILTASRGGTPPTVAEVQEALKALEAQAAQNAQETGSRKLSNPMAEQYKALLYEVPKNASKPMLYNNPPAPTPKTNFGDVMQGISKGVSSGVGGILGAFQNIGRLVADTANGQPESVEDMYKRLMSEYAPSYTGPSAEEMAQQEFAPQFDMLKQIAAQQKNRYDANAPKIVDLYRALNDSANKGRTDNAAMYDKTIAGSKAIQAEASKALQDRYNQSLAAQTEQFNRLGIQDAAPTVFADQAKVLNDNQAAQSQSSQVFQDLNNSLKGNQYAYDTTNIGIQKQAGNQAQQDFLQQYLDQQANNDMQRLQLQGQQQQQENAYAQQISQMLMGSGKDTQNFVSQMVGDITRDRQNQAENEFSAARIMNAQDQLALQKASQSGQKLNPYDALQQNAVAILGNPQAARQFSDVILEAYLRHPGARNLSELMDAVGPEFLGQNPAYTSLAFDFFNKMLASQKG